MPYKNPSTNEKTLKNMYALLNSDNYTIDKTIYYCNYNDEFISVYGTILDNYKDYFDQETIDVDVNKKYYYQPAAFAEYYYGTADLDFLVLYFAGMKTLFEFKKPVIKILPRSSIIKLNKLIMEYATIVKDSYINPSDYIEDIMSAYIKK